MSPVTNLPATKLPPYPHQASLKGFALIELALALPGLLAIPAVLASSRCQVGKAQTT